MNKGIKAIIRIYINHFIKYKYDHCDILLNMKPGCDDIFYRNRKNTQIEINLKLPGLFNIVTRELTEPNAK